MNTYIQPTRPVSLRTISPRPSPLAQAFLAVAGGMALFFVLLALFPIIYSLIYSGRIFPGVSVAGVNLAGLETPEAVALLSQKLQYPQTGRIFFQEGQKLWQATPREVGLFLDVENSVQAAYTVGRQGGLFARLRAQYQAWQDGIDLPPLLVFDERIAQGYLQGIAAQIDRPAIEASLSITGVDVVVNAGQVGRTLDIPLALEVLRAHLPSLTDGIVPLVVHESVPAILDAGAQAEIARGLLSAPLTVTVPDAGQGDPGPWTFSREELAGMLTIERVTDPQGTRYQVGLSAQSLRPFLEGIAPQFVRNAENARFIFNDETRQLENIQPAAIGRALDIDATLNAINTKIATGEHSVALIFAYTNPPVTTDATAESLGIRELVSSHTSYFYGSSASRIQNITTAAGRFHGVLVPPGATFSMADVLGDVSLDSGYAEALIIYGDRTIKGVGGGVCQVSTTLFRTAFFGGYPIVERHSHAYRVGYYEMTRSGGVDPDLAGLDATVFVPVVDFKFINDSPSWLLMETYVDPGARTLTWKFYSTSDGRTVAWDTTGPQNIVEPDKPVYEENPDLDEGEIKQVDWAAEGADVNVTRTVSRNGQVLFTDQFNTHYLPWRAVYQYGPGTELPDQEENHEEE